MSPRKGGPLAAGRLLEEMTSWKISFAFLPTPTSPLVGLQRQCTGRCELEESLVLGTVLGESLTPTQATLDQQVVLRDK